MVRAARDGSLQVVGSGAGRLGATGHRVIRTGRATNGGALRGGGIIMRTAGDTLDAALRSRDERPRRGGQDNETYEIWGLCPLGIGDRRKSYCLFKSRRLMQLDTTYTRVPPRHVVGGWVDVCGSGWVHYVAGRALESV